MEGTKKNATRFEEEIKQFLKKLEFEDVDGAKDTFQINGIQVDACGGHEDTLLIIECTRRSQLGKKSIRDKIKEFRGVVENLEKGFKSHPLYKKYQFYKYVIATNNIDIRKEDILFANSANPNIYLWDDNFVSYYESLFDKIHKYAKFNLLGEMRIRPTIQNHISVPAFLVNYGDIKAYNFLINPHDLLEVAYVARRETKNERFYQRIIKKDRLTEISQYVNDNNILPNNLILAFGDDLKPFIKFHIHEKSYAGKCTSGVGISYGILEFPRDYRSCWIIDGQHRLYSFVNVNKILNLPILAFENLSIEKQCKIFLDINKNQKPVPSDLVWDLNGDMIPSEEDGIISNLVKKLNDDFGPLFYKIFIPSKGIKQKRHLLKISSICIVIKKMKLTKQITNSKTQNPYHDPKPEQLIKNLHSGLSIYFKCVEDVFSDNWKLEEKGFVLTDGGIAVVIRIFEKIVSRNVAKGKPTDEEFKKYLYPLADLFKKQYSTDDKLKKLRLSITSEGGKEEILKEFILYIRQATGDKLFGGDLESDQGKKIKDLESKLKELIRIVLSKDEKGDWFKKYASQDIFKKAMSNMEKRGEQDPSNAYKQIIFGECIAIMRTNKEKFYSIFKTGEHGFGSDMELEGAFNFLSRIRTHEVHDIGSNKKVYDDELFEIYLEKIQICISKFLPIDTHKNIIR
jgi:DNA sulfur modification protein DndB